MSSEIVLTPLGHSCVLLELSGSSGPSRLLLDPGSLTPRLEPIADLDAVLITHAHPDHIDPPQIEALRAAGDFPVYGDAASAQILESAKLTGAEVIETGPHKIAGVPVEVSEFTHETIYPGVPLPRDFAYRIAERVFAPGDAFAVPDFAVDVLLLPTGAPWMKLSETIDYMREIAPKVVLPVHDGGLAIAHREMHRTLIEKFAPEETRVLRPLVGERISL
ncbi:MBL fold metallo-hydrolase [Arthrobacter sp. SD76]|uniref:MBL fold metallo-hydrolase n=1 Tax=Arthrobacter sp. SD76 TaxID=3415007 RepID=UPI003C7128A8